MSIPYPATSSMPIPTVPGAAPVVQTFPAGTMITTPVHTRPTAYNMTGTVPAVVPTTTTVPNSTTAFQGSPIPLAPTVISPSPGYSTAMHTTVPSYSTVTATTPVIPGNTVMTGTTIPATPVPMATFVDPSTSATMGSGTGIGNMLLPGGNRTRSLSFSGVGVPGRVLGGAGTYPEYGGYGGSAGVGGVETYGGYGGYGGAAGLGGVGTYGGYGGYGGAGAPGTYGGYGGTVLPNTTMTAPYATVSTAQPVQYGMTGGYGASGAYAGGAEVFPAQQSQPPVVVLRTGRHHRRHRSHSHGRRHWHRY